MKKNILIPLAGKGSRFKLKFEKPKPLIEFESKPMIQHVIESINIEGRFIFIIQKEHNHNNKLKNLLTKICDQSIIIEIDYYTEGAAQTCYLAKDYINNNEPLFITNCDQVYEWNQQNFVDYCLKSEYDGIVVTEKKNTPTYSYIKMNSNKIAEKLAEKKIISNDALIGMHYWRKGSDFISSVEKLIKRNIKQNNEYYLSLTYNILIEEGLKISNYQLKDNEKYYVIGTPKELFDYLNIKNIKLFNTDIVIAGNITKDIIFDIYNDFNKNINLGGIMNFWTQFQKLNKNNYIVDILPLSYGESVILLDKKKCKRYNRSELNILELKYNLKKSNWFHLMYINQLKYYNEGDIKKNKSMVLSCDICGGVNNKYFDVKLLKYFDFIFLTNDDLDKNITIKDIQDNIKGYIIIHDVKSYKIVGNKKTDINISIELDTSKVLENVNVLGAGDFFASSFVFYMMNKDINNIDNIKEAIIFCQSEVSESLKMN